jgi:hypothetical protein
MRDQRGREDFGRRVKVLYAVSTAHAPLGVQIGVQPALGGGEIVLIDGVASLKRRHRLVPGDLHRRECVCAGSPEIGLGGVAEIVKAKGG